MSVLKIFFSLAFKVTFNSLFQVSSQKIPPKNSLRPVCMLLLLPTSMHISLLTPCLLFQNGVSVQRSQKPVNWKQLTDVKDPSVLVSWTAVCVCVCFIRCLCCFEVTCWMGSEHASAIACCSPHCCGCSHSCRCWCTQRKEKKKRALAWHTSYLWFKKLFKCILDPNLLEQQSHVFIYICIFNRSCDTVK